MTSSPSIQLFPDMGFISLGFNSGVPVGGGDHSRMRGGGRLPRKGERHRSEGNRDGTGEMAQQTKCLLYKFQDRSSLPGTHIKNEYSSV